MCGICGKINRDTAKPVDRDLIEAMNNVILYRGPDDDGFYFFQNVGLAIRRLSIIDLSSGKQPIFNEDKTIAIVYNGEIYNFQQLRQELTAKGHKFRTQTDTETIVHLYEEEGEDCVKKLRGMFGFAIYDTNKRKLFLVRDRFGIKPIYYAFDNEKLLFGSELKCLLQDDSLQRDLDILSLNTYFSFMNTVAPNSIFSSVKKLLPGHYLTYQNDSVSIKQYWHTSFKEEANKLSLPEAEEQLLDIIQESVKIRLISDVPLGAFLSGGVDSSTIVALMSQVSSEPVKTFSIGFDVKAYNELEYAKKIAELFETDHHEYMVTPDATNIIDDLIWHLDEPFADASAIPTYFVSKIARENVTVVLTGDGGDEMFAGYPHYQSETLLNRIGKIPAFVRNGLIKPFLRNLPNISSATFNYQKDRLYRNLDRIDLTPEERFFSRHQVFSDDEKHQLYSRDLVNMMNGEFQIGPGILDLLQVPTDQNSINKLLYLDTNIYLPNDMLVKVDRMSMANSLEARVPLLDHKLAEFVINLPSSMKLRGSETKYILKKALSKLLPKEILYRKKQGFNIPLDVWFRNDLEEMARETLFDRTSTNRGFFKKGYIDKIIKSHKNKERDLSNQLWSLILFEKWCRRFVDK